MFVVYGRNEEIKSEIFAFLRILGLSPIPWGEAARLTDSRAPYIGKILDVLLRDAQAVVVLLTGDDEVRTRLIRSEFCVDGEDDKEDLSLSYQPRPNVVFETGMALSDKQADRTILVEVGDVSICQMLKGRDRIKLSNQWKHRWRFIQSLEAAGCSVIKSDLESIRNMGNFDTNTNALTKQPFCSRKTDTFLFSRSCSSGCIFVLFDTMMGVELISMLPEMLKRSDHMRLYSSISMPND